MKKLFEAADRYAAQSTWKDFALVKICLCALGILIGMLIPAGLKRPVRIAAGLVFAVTAAVLTAGFLRVIKQK